MKKKSFLFVLPVCLLFCLSFTTCEEEYKQVDDLWLNLRNTAWTKPGDNQVNTWEFRDGKGNVYYAEYTLISITYGFYGANRGPYPYNNAPYIVEHRVDRVIGSLPSNAPWDMKPERSFNSQRDNFFIDRTGNEIFWVFQGIDEKGNFFEETYANRVSVNGNILTIKEGKKSYPMLDTGTYTKISDDPNYKWD